MTRALVAGVGNLFFGDDGFGVELARRLAQAPPPGTRVAELGIRALHLAYELLTPFELFIAADCMRRGGAPGTLYVVEPELETTDVPLTDAHTMYLPAVFMMVHKLGGALPPTLILGCEPYETEPGIGLSPTVARSIPAALELIRELIAARLEPP